MSYKVGFLKKNSGLIILVCSLIIYSLIKLPLNLSVLCNSENEGFYFVFGKSFLEWKEFTCGPLFALLYAAVIKIFGFNTYSIIAVHIIQNIVIILIAILLYYFVNKLLNNAFYGSLTAFLWMFFVLTPCGRMTILTEVLTHFGLEAEYFCILFSLISLLLLLESNFFQPGEQILSVKERFLLFLSGLFLLIPGMFKPNGLGLFLAISFFFITLLIFERKYFRFIINKLFFVLFGIVFSLLLFQILPWIFNNDPLFWKKFFMGGSYSQEHLGSINNLFISLIKFMTRDSLYISNFVLFLVTWILLIWGFIRYFLFRGQEILLSRFWLLLSLWGFANVLLIIAPGIYQPYYYHLIWPIIAIAFVLGIRDLVCISREIYKKKVAYFVSALLVLFFVYKVTLVFPVYLDLYSRIKLVSVLKHPESFQDPVLSTTQNPLRPNFLKFADTINNLLPDKKDTFYVFNFNKEGLTNFTSASYIYAKRFPPTYIISDHFHYPNLLSDKLEILKKIFIERPPKLFVISKDVHMKPWQVEILTPFIKWFNEFLAAKYFLKLSLVNYKTQGGNDEVFLVYERKN